MTAITGIVKDSGGAVFEAELTITLDAPLLDGDSLLTKKPKVVDIPDTGVIDFELPESETSQITYKFDLRDSAGDYVVPPFHAIVPNVETVNFWELYPVSAVTDLLPAGLRRLAQIIATNPTYADALKGFRAEGDYDPDQFYSKGSLVTFSGGSFLYVAESIEKGRTPTLYNGSVSGNPVYWQTLAVKGDSSGLAPESDSFDRVLWTGNTQAPTKNSLAGALVDRNEPLAVEAWNKASIDDFDGLELLTLLDLVDHFAPLIDADLQGDAKAQTKGVGDATRSIATCAHVKNSIDVLATVYLTQAIAASTYLTISNAASAYLTISNAASTYLSLTNAASTYLTQSSATANYLGITNAASTYLTIANAASTYLTQASATSTYAPINSPTFTGSVLVPQPAFNLNNTTAANVKHINERLRVFVSGAGSQAVTPGVARTISGWTTESIDLDNSFNPTTGQWTCPATGYYRVYAAIALSRNTATFTASGFKVFYNVTAAQNGLLVTTDLDTDDYSALSGVVRCTQGNVYDFRLILNFTGTPTISGSTAVMSIEWVAP